MKFEDPNTVTVSWDKITKDMKEKDASGRFTAQYLDGNGGTGKRYPYTMGQRQYNAMTIGRSLEDNTDTDIMSDALRDQIQSEQNSITSQLEDEFSSSERMPIRNCPI